MRSLVVAAIAAALFAAGPVRAQTPATSVAPENLAAARQLIRVLKDVDQFNAKLPTLIVNLKPMIVQNRPEIEKQYDAMMPTFQQQAMCLAPDRRTCNGKLRSTAKPFGMCASGRDRGSE
jgi:hypothetical protein